MCQHVAWHVSHGLSCRHVITLTYCGGASRRRHWPSALLAPAARNSKSSLLCDAGWRLSIYFTTVCRYCGLLSPANAGCASSGVVSISRPSTATASGSEASSSSCLPADTVSAARQDGRLYRLAVQHGAPSRASLQRWPGWRRSCGATSVSARAHR